MKKTLALFLGLSVSLAILLVPGITSAASGGGGGGGNGGSGTAGGSGGQVVLDVGFIFSTNQLTCGQDNNVAVTVSNLGTSGDITQVGLGFETGAKPEIKWPADGQDGAWTVTNVTQSDYTGPTWQTDTTNGIRHGENVTYSTSIYVPCGPTQIKVAAGAANPKSETATKETTFQMVSGITSLPKTGSDTSALYYAILVGLPILRDLRKFIK